MKPKTRSDKPKTPNRVVLHAVVRRTMIWIVWKCGYILTPASALKTWNIEANEWETVARQYTHDEFMRGQASGRAEMLRRHVMYHKIWAPLPPNGGAKRPPN